jgi:hypothetical protein
MIISITRHPNRSKQLEVTYVLYRNKIITQN